MGQIYQPGTYTIDISKVLRNIEYMSPKSVQDVSGIEIHFRTNLNAGTVSADASKFLEALGMKNQSQHVHIVSKIDIEKLRNNKVTESAKYGEFYRRANLLAEMYEVLTNRRRLFMKIDEDDPGVTHFGITTTDKVEGIIKYFLQTSNGLSPKIKDKYKMGYVGMRGSDKYDSPGLWGLEYRSVNRKGNRNNYKKILDAIQNKMESSGLGIDDTEVENWLKEMNATSAKEMVSLISQNYYRRKNISQSGYTSPKLNEILGDLDRDTISKLSDLKDENLGIMMVFHNWDQDMLFYDKPDILERIHKNQMRAAHKIVRLLKEKDETKRRKATIDTIQNFIKDSKIFEIISESFELEGLDIRVKE